MKLLQLLCETVVDTVLHYLPKQKPSDLAYHIAWFNEQGWVARIYANGQIEHYVYRPYIIV